MAGNFGYVGSFKQVIDNLIAGAKNRANHTGTQAASTITGLAAVATSGAYGDLTGKPQIPSTPAQIGAEPAGLSAATSAAIGTQISAAVNALVSGAPGALDTLKELADAIGDDANFAATVTAALGNRLQVWQPNTAQPANAIRLAPDGSIVQANQAFTTGVSYVASNWTVLVPTAASVAATYRTLLTAASTFTWNTDGTIATETVAGKTTTFAWNIDGTLATETRDGVTRSYSYNSDGTLASVA